jgi:hypothetical protein
VTVKFAWPAYGAPWSLRLDEVEFDGVVRDAVVDATRRRLRLDEFAGWTSATFDVTATTDEDVPSGASDPVAFVTVSSSRSNSRVPFVLTAMGSDVRAYSGKVTIARAAFAGSADLTFDIGASIGGRRRRIGTSELWSIVLEPAEAPLPSGRPPFETTWIDFRDEAAPLIAREDPSVYAVMDHSEGKPRLLMNEGVDGLKDLLLAKAPQHERRRLSDIIGTLIARDAVGTLIRAAAAEVIPPSIDDTFEAQPPTSALYAQACEAVAKEMTSIASVDEFYTRLVEAARDQPEKQAQFWAEIDAATERLTNHASAVARAVDEVKHA